MTSDIKAKAQGMSGAGLAVVITMCLALLLVIITACLLALGGEEVPEALDRVLQGLLIGVPALLANTRRTAGADTPSPSEPQPVELIQDRPVETVEVEPAPGGAEPEALPRRRRT